MSNVWLSGPSVLGLRKICEIKDLPDAVKKRLDEEMETGEHFFIQDRLGIPLRIAKLLNAAGYTKVTALGKTDRLKIHGFNQWQRKGWDSAVRSMTRIAGEMDRGIFIWNEEDVPTFLEMMILTALGKPCSVYFCKDDRWKEIRTLRGLKKLAGPSSRLEKADMEKILEGCGFSGEMKSFILNGKVISESHVVDIICRAPVPLDKKLEMLEVVKTRFNEKRELYNGICIHEGKADEIQKWLDSLSPREGILPKGSVWEQASNAWWDLSWAECTLHTDDCGEDEDPLCYLHQCWYDTDVYIEKTHPLGLFRDSWSVEQYIQHEQECFPSDDTFYVVEAWDYHDPLRKQSRYDFYYFMGKPCWFERLVPEEDKETGNRWYTAKDRRYSSGDLDLGWVTPYKAGDIVLIDCRPFGPPFHAMILEGRNQWDCCFPTILFRIPETNEWRVTALKHRHFYKDAELGSYEPMVSPLYRLRKVRLDEYTEKDELLIGISRKIAGNEDRAAALWDAWHSDTPYYDKTEGQVKEIFEKIPDTEEESEE